MYAIYVHDVYPSLGRNFTSLLSEAIFLVFRKRASACREKLYYMQLGEHEIDEIDLT